MYCAQSLKPTVAKYFKVVNSVGFAYILLLDERNVASWRTRRVVHVATQARRGAVTAGY